MQKDDERPVHGSQALFQNPHWSDLLLFYEYFNGDTGAGLGANHQTGWTGLVATLIHHCAACEQQAVTQSETSLELIASTLR